jgi:RND family efflux transporter MFP subunit
VGAEVNGVRLTEVLVEVGDTVRKGQVLARLDDASLFVELKLQQAALAEAEANLAQAQLSAERAGKLGASRAISQQDLLQYKTAAKTGAAKVAMAQAQVEALQLRLRNTRILAPDDGIISSSTATVGVLSDRTPELFKLIRKGRVEWRAEVPPEQQVRLQPGQAVELRDLQGHLVAGRVRTLAPTADAHSRTSLVYVDLPSSQLLKPGILVTGEFWVSNRRAMTIPQSALVFRDGFNYAMTVDAHDRVQLTKLTLGTRQGDQVEVLDGLKMDDRIVASGGAFLQEGDRVRVTEAPPVPSEAAMAIAVGGVER